MRAGVRFFGAKNVPVSAMRQQHIVKLCHTFQSVRHDVKSRNIIESGRPSYSMTQITTARIGKMIQKDQWVTLRAISSELGLSYGSVQHIVSDMLRY
ncbi:hypothetical protein TNCV_1563651 [Trichonephila clavipes]|nr:hypothetical protein TNCV_1563651 [Trichonephila clavipes]